MPQLFLTLVGLAMGQFQDLLLITSTQIENTTITDQNDKGVQSGGRPRSLSTRSQLMLTLIWLRQYCSESFLSWIFNITQSQVYTYTRATLRILHNSISHEVHFPTFHVRAQHGLKWRGRWITIVIDGAEQEVLVPSNTVQEKLCYSGKKRKHTATKLIGCTPTGKIIFLSDSYFGSNNDMALMNKSENAVYNWLSWSETIMADCGFKNLPKNCAGKCQFVIPFDEQYSEYLTAEDVLVQAEIKHIRTVIENVIAQIKKWKICAVEFRGKSKDRYAVLEEHHCIWTVCSSLVNLFSTELRDY